MDETYEEMKNILKSNCDECRIINQKIAYIVEFKNKEDAEWFENNIIYPESVSDKSPIKHVMKMSKESKEFAAPFYDHVYTFEVKDRNRLLEKLKEK